MTAKLRPNPVFRSTDANGNALSGGKVYTYDPGTTDAKATYADAAAATPLANPVILDTRGEAQIYWGTGNYKIVIKDSSDVTVDTIDPFDPQVADPVAPSDNKVENGSFEADSDSDGTPDNWTLTAYTNGTIARDATENSHGAASLKCISPGGASNGGGWANGDQFAVSENVAVLASVETKSSVAGVHSKAEVRFFTDAAGFISASTIFDLNGGNPTAWTLFRSSISPPTTARYAAVYVYGCIDDNTTAGTTWFDNCVVRDTVAGVTTHTATATLTGADAGLNLVDASAGAVTLTLPAAADVEGMEFVFVATDATNTITIQRAGSDTINGDVSFTFAWQYEPLALVSDGVSMWSIVNKDRIDGRPLTDFSVSSWLVGAAVYNGVSFSVTAQDTSPYGIAFKSDGTKMYMVGLTNDTVYQYSLSTAWDMSTASYDTVSFSVSAQDTSPTGIAFKSDGTKMYMVGVTNDTVYQYSLSTAWDMSTASYDTVSFSVSAQDTAPNDIAFKSDGTKMYMVGATNGTVYQYITNMVHA